MFDPGGQVAEHWYSRDGLPAYSQPKRGGGETRTTLRHARQLGLVPSVTTVLEEVINKPALNNWKVDQGILAALTLPRVEGETEQAFLQRVRTDSRAQAKAAAEEGTRIHEAVEASFASRPFPARYVRHVDAARALIARLFPDVTDWVTERSFCHPKGFGGKVDLHSPTWGIVVDFKGKDGDFTDGKKLAWDQHWQLSAYQRGLNLPPAPCANVFISRTHPGAVAEHVWTLEELSTGWRVFQHALCIWKLIKGFDPAF